MSTTFINRGHMYAPHVFPVIIDTSFTVAPADAAGLGIIPSSLKGQGVANVFMHTSATPGKGSNGQLNPNPPNGYIYVQLADNYTRLFSSSNAILSPLTGSQLTAITANVVYVITALGTATAAQWLAAGVPPGVVPSVGLSFIALASVTIGGAATVQVPVASGIDQIEIVGNPNLSLGPIPVGGSPNVGGLILMQCLNSTSTSVTTLIPSAPAVGTGIKIALYLSQSSVMTAGE